MVNVDEIAAQALYNCTELTSQLAEGAEGIYHDMAPDDGQYPMVQYSDISETPALHGDNKPIAFKKVIRVSTIDNTPARRHALKEAIMACMQDAGFMWQATNTLRVDREYYTILDFIYGSYINTEV